MKLIYAWTLIMIITLILAACQPVTKTQPVEITGVEVKSEVAASMEPYVYKTSEPDMVTLYGELIVTDPLILLPDKEDAIYLVSLEDSGAGPATIPQFIVGEVPQAEVDERTGEFVFTNILPGQYAIVVLSQGGGQVPARWYENGNFAIIMVEESDINDLIELDDLSFP